MLSSSAQCSIYSSTELMSWRAAEQMSCMLLYTVLQHELMSCILLYTEHCTTVYCHVLLGDVISDAVVYVSCTVVLQYTVACSSTVYSSMQYMQSCSAVLYAVYAVMHSSAAHQLMSVSVYTTVYWHWWADACCTTLHILHSTVVQYSVVQCIAVCWHELTSCLNCILLHTIACYWVLYYCVYCNIHSTSMVDSTSTAKESTISCIENRHWATVVYSVLQ